MIIHIGTDHRGFELKEKLIAKLKERNIQVNDVGNNHYDPEDDYVDFAYQVALNVSRDTDSMGVVLCGSGAGADMAANKVHGIRSALAFDVGRAKQARTDDDANVIALPADYLDENTAWEMVREFVNTAFSGESRHVRRLQKLRNIEHNG